MYRAPASSARTAAHRIPQLSDISIGGDPLAIAHHAPRPPERPSTVAEFSGIVRRITADRARWADLVDYDPVSRWYHRLEVGPGYEVWLLSWVPGQGSGRHDHGPSHGVYTVLQGALTERAWGAASGEAVRQVRPGTQRVFAPGYVHEVVNDTLEPAVSLHLYFPGLSEMTVLPQPPRGCSEPVNRAC